MTNLWNGVVNVIFHNVRSEKSLDDELVERITRALLTEPIGTMTPAQEYETLANGLRRGTPLPTVVSMRQSPAELRNFLARIVNRMDELRPWTDPPFMPLPHDRILDFGNPQPIARIDLSKNHVEAVVARPFQYTADGAYLLLQLRSGAIIGMFWPFTPGRDDVMLASMIPGQDPVRLIDELAGFGRIDRHHLIPLTPDDIAAAASLYDTTPIRREFVGENQPGNRVWGTSHVRYLTVEERHEFELYAGNGLLYDARDQLYDTTDAQTLWTPRGGRAIFVMDELGVIYSSPHHILGKFHHSSFLAGNPVAGAGEISVQHGRVQLVSDQSSHYRPARRFTNQVIDSLARQGIDPGHIQVEYHQPADDAPPKPTSTG